jgi:hypothetical protein
MGKLQAKIGLASVLWKYTVEFKDKDDFPDIAEFQKTQFFLRSSKPFNFQVTERR